MDEIPEGWQTFTVALPPNLYAKLRQRAEAENSDLLMESAYLLTAALDMIPPLSETQVPELSGEKAKALQQRLMALAQEVGARTSSP